MPGKRRTSYDILASGSAVPHLAIRQAAPLGRRRPPQPPGIPLKYICYLGPKDDRIAVFEDDDELFLAKSGEVLLKKFRVVEIRYETVVMGFTDQKWLDRTRELTMSSN